jgi:23S rRNA (cytosine1962-C5)-methyltransferase
VGQWGAQLARVVRHAGATAHVTALDTSAPALELAALNVAAAGAACEAVRADVLEALEDLPPRAWDVVVADPPAFIKGRKAYPTGRAAYVKLHSAALRRVRPGGLLVACSCSQLLDEADFAAVLHKAAGRAEVAVRWVARGGQGPDHPVLAGFPEGHYLKCWIGLVG